MANNATESGNSGMKELKKFYQQKKDEQKALKKLLKALDKEFDKSKKK